MNHLSIIQHHNIMDLNLRDENLCYTSYTGYQYIRLTTYRMKEMRCHQFFLQS